MSITALAIQSDGSVVKSKSNFYDFENDKFNTDILFGNTDDYMVKIGKTKEFVFQIQVETLEYFNLSEERLEVEKPLYQSIQGVSVVESFELLDVSLSSDTPDKTRNQNR